MSAYSHKQTLSIPQQKRNLAHRDAGGGGRAGEAAVPNRKSPIPHGKTAQLFVVLVVSYTC